MDFLGGIQAVQATARAFSTRPIIHEDRITDFGIDNAGQLIIAPFGSKGALLVDFLYAPLGLSPTDVLKQAILLSVPDRNLELRVMHPVHCLESRLTNRPVTSRASGGIEARRKTARAKTVLRATCHMSVAGNSAFK